MRTHDIVVIGGSAGALDALRVMVRGLPEDLTAALFVVLHVGERSQLASLLDREGPLPVMEARNGAAIEHGKIYVAVPGFHLMLHDDHILLRRGPRENLARPAVDPLFRSAAASFGSRVIGVVLSGALSDGTSGLHAIKRCGGIAIAQDAADAIVPSMPRSALRHVELDYVATAGEMAGLLSRLVREEAGESPTVPVDIRLEAAIAAQQLSDMKADDMLGKVSPFTCPECHGALWQIDDGSTLRYRCHVGHAFTADAVLSAEGEEIERTLGRLQRSHQERAALTRVLAERERAEDRHRLADQFESRARDYEDDARLIRELVRRRTMDAVANPSDQVAAEEDEVAT